MSVFINTSSPQLTWWCLGRGQGPGGWQQLQISGPPARSRWYSPAIIAAAKSVAEWLWITSSTIIEPEWSSTILRRVEIREDFPAPVLPTMPTWVWGAEKKWQQDCVEKLFKCKDKTHLCATLNLDTDILQDKGKVRTVSEVDGRHQDSTLPCNHCFIVVLLWTLLYPLGRKERGFWDISLRWGDKPGQLVGGRRGRRWGASWADHSQTFPLCSSSYFLLDCMLPEASLCSQPTSPKNWFLLETRTSVSSRKEWMYKPAQ